MPTVDPATVPVRPAATVMLLRDTAAGIEVFMLRRTTAALFAGGMYVFPGGRVDPTDGEGDAGFRAAAIRECYEEAGVLLAEDADGRMVEDGHPALDHRVGVYDGSVDVNALCASHGLRVAADQMAWVSHWVTPIAESRRFDTRFFVALAPPHQTSHHDDNETIESLWVRPADALEHHASGKLRMLPPTIENLRFLALHSTAADALAAAREVGTPDRILPKVLTDASGRFTGVLMPGEAGYDDVD